MTLFHGIQLLRRNILGVEQVLDLLTKGPATTEQVQEHLSKTVGVKRETDMQVKFRLQWLVAAGAVTREGARWSRS